MSVYSDLVSGQLNGQILQFLEQKLQPYFFKSNGADKCAQFQQMAIAKDWSSAPLKFSLGPGGALRVFAEGDASDNSPAAESWSDMDHEDCHDTG